MSVNMTPEQRAAGRVAARIRRTEKARHLNRIRSLPNGESARAGAELLRDPDEHAGAITVRRLVVAVRWRGDEWQRLAYAHAGITNPDKHIRDLTERQRHAMADILVLTLGQVRQLGRAAVDLGVAPYRLPQRLESAHMTAAIRALSPYVASPVVAAAARAALEAAAAVSAQNELRPAEVSGP